MHPEERKYVLRMQSCNNPLESQNDLMDMIWYQYYTHNPVSSDEITALCDSMAHLLNALSRKRRNIIYRTVLELCVAHERTAFKEGIRVGMQLKHEIQCTESNN